MSWTAATAGQPVQPGQINQFLETHSGYFVYAGSELTSNPAQNLLSAVNADFETTGWTWVPVSGTCTLAQSASGTAHTGSFSLEVTPVSTDIPSVTITGIAIVERSIVSVSVWVYSATQQNFTLTAISGTDQTATLNVPASTWIQLSLQFASITPLWAVEVSASANAIFYLDTCQFVAAPLGAFSDGTLTNLPGAGSNLFSALDASFEGGTGTWSAGSNWTISDNSGHFLDGGHSLQGHRKNTTPGNGYAISALYAATASTPYMAMAFVYSDTTSMGKPYLMKIQDQAGNIWTTTMTTSQYWNCFFILFTSNAATTSLQMIIADDPQSAPANGQNVFLDECFIGPFSGENLVYDSLLVRANQSPNPTWGPSGITWGNGQNQWQVTNPGTDNAQFLYTGNGSAVGNHNLSSENIIVAPGDVVTISALANGAGITAGNFELALYDPTVTTNYGSVAVTPTTAGLVSATITIPAGVTTVVAAFLTNNATVAANGTVACGPIQVTVSPTVLPFQPGPMWSPGVVEALGYVGLSQNTFVGQQITPPAGTTQLSYMIVPLAYNYNYPPIINAYLCQDNGGVPGAVLSQITLDGAVIEWMTMNNTSPSILVPIPSGLPAVIWIVLENVSPNACAAIQGQSTAGLMTSTNFATWVSATNSLTYQFWNGWTGSLTAIVEDNGAKVTFLGLTGSQISFVIEQVGQITSYRTVTYSSGLVVSIQ